MIGVVDWVAEYAATNTDAPSFSIMKANAIKGVLEAQSVMDALTEKDESYGLFEQDRSEMFACYDTIDARQKELGLKRDVPHGYGVTAEQIAAFEKLNVSRTAQD